MSFNVRVFGYSGIVQVGQPNADQFSGGAVFLNEEPCLWSQLLVCDGSSNAVTSAAITTVPDGTQMVCVEVPDGHEIRYEVVQPGVAARAVSSSSRRGSGSFNLAWSPGFRLSILDAVVAAVVPPPSATDPFWLNVVLLLSGDGTNGSTVFTDESPKLHGNALVNSTATVSTAQKVFGTGSILGPRLSYANSVDWDFQVGYFTLEGRIRPTDVTTFQMILAHWLGVVGFPFQSWYVSIQSGKLKWTVSTDGFNSFDDMTSSTTLVVNTWYAWAIDFDGTKYRMYLDGVMVAWSLTPRTIFTLAPALGERLGINDSGDGGFPYSGYQDEVRITKGVARYASDGGYTVATAAFPRA